LDLKARGQGTLKTFQKGCHRLVTPEKTLERIMPMMPVMGITRIANVTGLDVIGIPVVMVCRPNSRSISVSQGKGMTLAAAKASGLMESVELYHAEHITLPLKLATHNELRFTHNLADVNLLPRFKVSVFHDEARILWIQGEDIMSGQSAWAPYELVHMNCSLPFPPGSGCFMMGSNGLASGNHLLEAINHGICEVVERDADTLWSILSQQEKAKTRLKLETVDDPNCRSVLQSYERANVSVGVWNTTSDCGIPTFRCTIVDRNPHPSRPSYVMYGTGCHPSREIALMRALTEAAQSRLTAISSSRDDIPRGDYEQMRNPDAISQVRNALHQQACVQDFQTLPTFNGQTFEEDLNFCVDRLRSIDVKQIIVFNLTKPELGIPVARVVIPGLESMHKIPGFTLGARAREKMNQAESP